MSLRLLPAVLLVAIAPLGAQTSRVIDEGSFTVTRGAAPLGTEAFKIVRRFGAEGPEYVAQCTRTLEGKVVRTSLTIDTSGNPSAYTRTTTGAGQGVVTAKRAMNRITVNEEGASSRDFVFTPGMLILDDDVIHQLYFVTWRDARPLTYLNPGAKGPEDGVLTEVGRETVTIGRTAVPATRFSFGSGDDRREIWIDSSRRLLKVTQPAKQIVVLRDLPPR